MKSSSSSSSKGGGVVIGVVVVVSGIEIYTVYHYSILTLSSQFPRSHALCDVCTVCRLFKVVGIQLTMSSAHRVDLTAVCCDD